MPLHLQSGRLEAQGRASLLKGARGEIMIEQDNLKSWGEIPCGTSKRHNTELRAQKEDRANKILGERAGVYCGLCVIPDI
ncbi:unnamed protein product [Caretta caretta]